jgi:hypothetical protein
MIPLFAIFTIALLLLSFEDKSRLLTPEYQVRFGIIREDKAGRFDIPEETGVVPLITEDTAFTWGYMVIPPNLEPYATSELLVMPAPPKRVEFSVPIEQSDQGRIIKTTDMARQDVCISFFRFNDGDPLGQWRLIVYVNGEAAREVSFRVVPPRRPTVG